MATFFCQKCQVTKDDDVCICHEIEDGQCCDDCWNGKTQKEEFEKLTNQVNNNSIEAFDLDKRIKFIEGLNIPHMWNCYVANRTMELSEEISDDKLLEDLGKYLKSKGWNPLVIGFKGISKRELKNNYSLVIDFTGTKEDEKKVKE